LINLAVQHGQTLNEARRRLEMAVQEIGGKFGTLIRRIEWAENRTRVTLEGVGFWVEVRVDALQVHVTGDILVLGRLLGAPVSSGVRQILERTFGLQLP
jgi:hypothetical protein